MPKRSVGMLTSFNTCQAIFFLPKTLFGIIFDHIKQMTIMKTLTSILMGILGGGIAFTMLHKYNQNEMSRHQNQMTIPSKAVSLFEEKSDNYPIDFTLAADKSVNAVVHIKSTLTQRANNNLSWNPFFEFFYGSGLPQQYQTQISAGSGVIVSPDGYIITNNHVIQGASSLEVVLNNKKTYPAQVIGYDASVDLALLKIEAQGLPAIQIANSDLAKIGEWVLAVGNPFNLTSTVTAGIISAKGRDIDILKNDYNSGTPALEAFIQTDAAVNPGNSGGALVNIRGELIGINTAIKSNTGSYAGYAFAIPSNIVQKTIVDFIEFGSVQRGFLGVTWMDISPELGEKIKKPDLQGVYISAVSKSGAADVSGIKPGDVILSVHENPVHNITELQEHIACYRPGDVVSISILRDGETLKKSVTLKNRLGSSKPSSKSSQIYVKNLGAYMEHVLPEDLTNLNIPSGVRVTSLSNGILFRVGVLEGYIISKINQMPVYQVDDVLKLIDKAQGGILLEGYYPDGTYKPYAFGK